MKAKKPGTDQQAEITVYGNGIPCAEYCLPSSLPPRKELDADFVECVIPVMPGQAITVKGSFEGSMLHGSIDLVVDGSFVMDARMEGNATGAEVKYKRKPFWFQKAFDNVYPTGWTSIEQPKSYVEGILHVKRISPTDSVKRDKVEVPDVDACRPGVGSIEVILSSNQRTTDQYIDRQWDMTLGRWRHNERGIGKVRQNDIEPEFELEVREEDKVSLKRGLRHRQHWCGTRFGDKPWARFIFYYRSQVAIGRAGCQVREKKEVHELAKFVGCKPFNFDSTPRPKKAKKRCPRSKKDDGKRNNGEVFDDGESLFIPDGNTLLPPDRPPRDLTIGAPPFGFRALGGSLFGEPLIDANKATTGVKVILGRAKADFTTQDVSRLADESIKVVAKPNESLSTNSAPSTDDELFGSHGHSTPRTSQREQYITPPCAEVIPEAITSPSQPSRVSLENEHEYAHSLNNLSVSDSASASNIHVKPPATDEDGAVQMECIPSIEKIIAIFPPPPASVPHLTLEKLLDDALHPHKKTLTVRNAFNARVQQVAEPDPVDALGAMILRKEPAETPSPSESAHRKRTVSESVPQSGESSPARKKVRTGKVKTKTTASSPMADAFAKIPSPRGHNASASTNSSPEYINTDASATLAALRAQVAERRAKLAAKKTEHEAKARLKAEKEKARREVAEREAKAKRAAAEREEIERLMKEQLELAAQEEEIKLQEELDEIDDEEAEMREDESEGERDGELELEMGSGEDGIEQIKTKPNESEHEDEGESESEGGDGDDRGSGKESEAE